MGRDLRGPLDPPGGNRGVPTSRPWIRTDGRSSEYSIILLKNLMLEKHDQNARATFVSILGDRQLTWRGSAIDILRMYNRHFAVHVNKSL